MYEMWLFINICLARLSIWSPDELISLSIANAIASFGDPFIFPRYGRLVPVYYSGKCSFSERFEENTFALLYGFDDCYFSDLAISTQNSGGIGMIDVASYENINYIMIPKDEASGKTIDILSITIQNSDGQRLSQYSDSTIWASYSLDVTSEITSETKFYMSSNYTLDKAFISAFKDISEKFPIDLSYFEIVFCYETPDAEGIDYINDCLASSSAEYCLPHTSTVKGSQKINNSAVIINYYNTLSGPAIDFLTFLTKLYSTCEFDYSSTCIQNVLTSISSNPTPDTSLDSLETIKDYLILAPFYMLNSNFYFWSNSIEKTYCLSLSTPPSNCEECSQGCTYFDLFDPTCKDSCNVESCSFDFLACMQTDGCYDFIIGDGNCNSACYCDSDCGCGEDSCSIGCLYSDMEEGNCPKECIGECFDYCSSDFCSPGCSYQEIYFGDCPGACTSACSDECPISYCNSGCSYDDMDSGLCPAECTGQCFEYCSDIYCSPGCTFDSLTDNSCPDVCEEKCCLNENQSTNAFIYYMIIAPIVIGLVG